MGITPGGRTTGPVSLAMRRASSNDGESGTVCLEITDQASRIIVAQIELDAEQFLNLLSNRTAYGPSSWTNHLDRIGKVMQHGSDIRPGSLYGNQMAADHHAQIWAAENDWTYATARRNNVGNWVFDGRRWVDPEPGQEPSGMPYQD